MTGENCLTARVGAHRQRGEQTGRLTDRPVDRLWWRQEGRRWWHNVEKQSHLEIFVADVVM